MSEVYLTKVGVIYMSSSGPGTSRYIVFKDKSLMLTEKCDIESNKCNRPPVQTVIQISKEATDALNEYAKAYGELQKAQAKFKEVKKSFLASDGGKELNKIIHPQEEQLRPSDVFNTGDINALTREIEEKGECTVTSTIKEVQGYNAGVVKFSLSKPVVLDKINTIAMGDYKYARYGYGYKTENGQKIVETAVFEKAGRQYPPYRDDDYYEVVTGEEKKLKEMDEENKAADAAVASN